jgi:chromate transport protein ChrA
MTQARILQLIALILLILGAFLLHQHFTNKSITVSIYSGLGPIIMALAIFLISRNHGSKMGN